MLYLAFKEMNLSGMQTNEQTHIYNITLHTYLYIHTLQTYITQIHTHITYLHYINTYITCMYV
jgi:hypothetical protein